MKLVITGHTSPMGKEVYEHYKKTHDCLGVSRATGYDLNKQEDQDRLVSEVLARDIFLKTYNQAKKLPRTVLSNVQLILIYLITTH